MSASTKSYLFYVCVFAFATCTVVLGCTNEGQPLAGPQDAGLSSLSFPCDVDSVLERNCRECHTSRPQFGAPMPLVRYADVFAALKSDPTKRVIEQMPVRIHSQTDPMPPNHPLSSEDRQVLERWFDDRAPARSANESCSDGGVSDAGQPLQGPEHLPCTPTHTFRAHALGSSTNGFAVPEDAGNLYECFAFKSPFSGSMQATAWAPIIDDERVIHHWILYRTQTTQVEGNVMKCRMPRDAIFVAGWAPGAGNVVLPDDIGLELPNSNEYFILQIHYWNTARLADSIDRSGIALCTTETPRPQIAGVLTLGNLLIHIPQGAQNWEVQGVCTSQETSQFGGDINILSSFPHMHMVGKKFRTEILRGGIFGPSTTLIQLDRWDFNHQDTYLHNPPVILQPGDAVRTTCTYQNNTDHDISFGERSEDEMCFNFMLVYPVNALQNRKCGWF